MSHNEGLTVEERHGRRRAGTKPHLFLKNSLVKEPHSSLLTLEVLAYLQVHLTY